MWKAHFLENDRGLNQVLQDLFQKTSPKRHRARNSSNMERPFTGNCKMTGFNRLRPYGIVSYSSDQEINRAMDDRLHVIGGKHLKIKFLGRGHKMPVSLYVGSLPENVTEETLRNEFSKYGTPVYWKLENDRQFNQLRPYGIVAYSSEQEIRMAEQLLDKINNVPEAITEEDLIAFYSKYRQLRECRVLKEKLENLALTYLIGYLDESFNRAIDDRPHIIGGKLLKIQFIAKCQNTPVSLFVGSPPENVTDETLCKEFSKYGTPVYWKLENDRGVNQSGPYGIVAYSSEQEGYSHADMPEGIPKEDLITFYSKYGQLGECRVLKGKTGKSHAYVSYSAIDELNRAIADRPHVIDGKPLKIKFLCQNRLTAVSLDLFQKTSPKRHRARNSSNMESPFTGNWKMTGFNRLRQYGIVSYSSEQEALNALNSGPHTIEGSVVDVRKAKEANKSFSIEKSNK
ncbi:RNA recognition motif domain-containing protein [Ditylenchus destructor]|nr:RNA recognition motif domain-containing protein [Ditylenchus destructor]